MFVCVCKGITDSIIQQAIEDGYDSYGKLKKELGTGSQCGKCKQAIKDEIRKASKNTL